VAARHIQSRVDKRAVIQMLKVHFLTKAGRTAILSRDAEPNVDPLAEQLNLDCLAAAATLQQRPPSSERTQQNAAETTCCQSPLIGHSTPSTPVVEKIGPNYLLCAQSQ
jgi:hypothetical protein